MHELTYRDYIKYLEIKMSRMSIDSLTSDENKYFNLIKKQLETAPTLPSYILDEPLLSSKDYDVETLAAIAEIIETVSIQGRIKNIIDLLVSSVLRRTRALLSFLRSPEAVVVLFGTVGVVILAFLLFNGSITSTSSSFLAGSAGNPTETVTSPGASPSPIGLSNSLVVLGAFITCLIVVAFFNRKK